MSDNEDWPVQVPYSKLKAMQSKISNQERQMNGLREEIAELQVKAAGTEGDGGALARGLIEALRQAVTIVRWAVGNYDPETVIGWPYESLRLVAAAVKALPGATQIELEWAQDVLMFARNCEMVERFRKSGRQKELGAIPRELLGTLGYQRAAENMFAAAGGERTLPDQQSVQQEAGDAEGDKNPESATSA